MYYGAQLALGDANIVGRLYFHKLDHAFKTYDKEIGAGHNLSK